MTTKVTLKFHTVCYHEINWKSFVLNAKKISFLFQSMQPKIAIIETEHFIRNRESLNHSDFLLYNE